MHQRAFSLVEISMVLVILGLISAGIVMFGQPAVEQSKASAAARNLQTIDEAIAAYVRQNGRLPCPASASLIESSSNFGIEAASPGTCTGGTPASVFLTSTETVVGAVPTVTLGISTSLARDPWDSLIIYYVDRRLTAADAFTTTYLSDSTTAGDITVNDITGAARTSRAVYALVSPGADTSGGFNRQGTQAGTSSDANEQENYDFTGAAGVDRVLVQAMSTPTFDDIVSYKLRRQLRP